MSGRGARSARGANRSQATIATLLRQVPSTAWICMVVAFLSAACWSFITPAFEVPDEPDHFAYVQQLAETGRLPSSGERQFSQEELVALRDLQQSEVMLQPQNHSVPSAVQQRRLERDLSAPFGRENGGRAGVAYSEPPLYYALQAIPYGLGSGGTLLDRLELMRLLSALMAGFTALFAFMFVREALPGASWAWAVGGLGVAVTPLLGFMSGAVNPDSMLYMVSAALFYCLARAFRMGLTQRSALVIGAVIAIGLMTKLNFVGVAPGACLGLVLLARRAAGTVGRLAYRWLALGLALGLSPALLYALFNAVSSRPLLGIVPGSARSALNTSIPAELSYIWQLYLPRLPGMAHDFPHYLPTLQIWFHGYVGLYGWFDVTFPGWLYRVALIAAAAILALAARTILVARHALRERLGELLVYATIGGGVMVLIGADSYTVFPSILAEYGQTRYLLPMLPLLGAVFALAARGAGRRRGPAVGVALLVLLLSHDIFSQLQTIARYYG